MNNGIYPCILFDENPAPAAAFYLDVFPGSKIVTQNPFVTEIELYEKKLTLLQGPKVTKSPALSIFITCATESELVDIYTKLKDSELMPLQSYPFAEKYGWVKDKYGMTWQLMLNTKNQIPQRINLACLFVNKSFGKAAEAMQYYINIFPNSELNHKELYAEDDTAMKGNIKFAHFTINGEMLSAMDGPGNHDFDFTEGVSIVVSCDTQQQIDKYWDGLTEGGKEGVCGWVTDKFGVSWQIVPKIIGKLLADAEKMNAVMEVVQSSKKLNIAALEAAGK